MVRRMSGSELADEELKRRAQQVLAGGLSQITAGKPGEQLLGEWQHECVRVRILPDDLHGILRLSAGGLVVRPPASVALKHVDYCVIRGDVNQCIELLERVLRALRAKP